jgi:hypothetical protein
VSPGLIRRSVALVTLAALLAACATTQLPPISTAGPAFEPLPDERELWAAARAEEEKLVGEVRIYQDPLLVDYLEELVGAMNPPAMAANREVRYRVAVVEIPPSTPSPTPTARSTSTPGSSPGWRTRPSSPPCSATR